MNEETLLERTLRLFTEPPCKGVPADELTDREKLALAAAVGVPVELELKGYMLTLSSKVPFAVDARPDGGYYVYFPQQEARHAH
jgi:hypothetical protein